MTSKRKSDTVIKISDDEEDQIIPKTKRTAFNKAFSLLEMIFHEYEREEKQDSFDESMVHYMTVPLKNMTLKQGTSDGVFPEINGMFYQWNVDVHSAEDEKRGPRIHHGVLRFYFEGKVEILFHPLGIPGLHEEEHEEIEKIRNDEKFFFPNEAKVCQEYSYFLDFEDWILTPSSDDDDVDESNEK